MSEAMKNKYKNLNVSWNAYMETLEKAEIMLKEKQDEFQEMLLLDQEKFKEEVQKFGQTWENYKQTTSLNPNLDSEGL